MIKEIFDNLGDLAGVDNNNKDKKSAEILLKVKNMITDRHVVNNCLKSMLEKWWADCLPPIIDNFNTFSDDLKKSIIDINHFKCNLHVLVNLGSQAEIALKGWAKAIILRNTFDWGVASTPDFIRATTKLCVPGADQKSGYGFLFETYLKSCVPPVKLHMSTFYGHRINILFSMTAAVCYHNDQIKDFLSTYFEEKSSNKLVSCVSHYVNNKVYVAGCRALSIIDKLLTGPLWKQIESTKHILDLSMWLTFGNFLDAFSRDSSDLLKGTILFPEFTKQDEIFDRLFSVQDEQLNILTAEALQILCTNFMIVVSRQLVDYLPGGKFSIDSSPNFEKLKENSITVSPTNIDSERDFANLDRLRREKPNANTIALEGIILFTNNKTLNWLDNLDADKKTAVFKMARENAPKMLQHYKEQKHILQQKHIEILQKKKDEAISKQQRKNDEIIKIKEDIDTY
ncbi:unnamed protein product [Mytilus coruscus]|uniref:Uncharacterized protein n=1 Tax=Mytilus coruscus TaxID=42192 RepID=A0A6J8BYK5_MYTCO|nr:unnamed protein product [Mytilus coruscus]